MTTLAVLGATASGVAILAFIFAVAKWSSKVDRNTEATDRLTNSFTTITDKLMNHEVRIAVLEKTQVKK